MNVRVKLFALAKERAGQDELIVDLANGATIADLHAAIAEKHPSLSTILPHALWAVDRAYANPATPITEHSEIALIPPVSGG